MEYNTKHFESAGGRAAMVERSENGNYAVFMEIEDSCHFTADQADEIAEHLKQLAQEWRDKQPKKRYYREGFAVFDRNTTVENGRHRMVGNYLTDEDVAFLNAGAEHG